MQLRDSKLKIKTNIDHIMKYSNATPFLTKTNTGIICSYCIKTCDNIRDLKIHINDAHKDKILSNFRRLGPDSLSFNLDITDLKCNICDKDFNVISSLKHHLIKYHNIIFYSDVKDYFCEFKLNSDNVNNCALCDEIYDSFLLLVQHVKSHYNNYTCSVCKAGFINSQALKFHESKCSKSETKKVTKKTRKTNPSSLKSECQKIKYNTQNILKYSNCTPFINQTVAGISCAFCDSCLTNIQEMKTHVTEHYKEDNYIDKYRKIKKVDYLVIKLDITDLACNICNRNFDHISDLKEHLIKEHSIVFFNDVNDCFAEFKLTSNGILTCVFCKSNYETFKSMLQHLSKHYNNYCCEVCNASFFNKKYLRTHTKNVHSTRSYKCSICSKVFSNNDSKSNHERVVHRNESRFKAKCPLCDATFKGYSQRNRHVINEHNTKAAIYNCNRCDKTFLLKKLLTNHVKRVHLMEKNHVCSRCNYRCVTKGELKDHILRHERGKTYQCGVCFKRYARKKALKHHIVSKHKTAEYECSETVNVDDSEDE